MAGNLNYFEIPADDAERAKGFWASLFGWEFRDQPADVPYAMAQAGDLGVGLYETDDDRGLWAYFYVDDLDPAVRQVEELGGKVAQPGPGGRGRLVRPLRGHRGQQVRPVPDGRIRRVGQSQTSKPSTTASRP